MATRNAHDGRRMVHVAWLMPAFLLIIPACSYDHESDPAAYDRIAHDKDAPLRYDDNPRWVPVPLFSLYPRSGMLYIGDEDHGRRLAAERAARQERERRAVPESRPSTRKNDARR